MRSLNGSRMLLRGWQRCWGAKRGRAAEAERASDLGCGLALTMVDFGERLVVDHDRLRGQGGAGAGRSDMARMSWPRRNKRSVVRAMSTCSGVPTR
jgi:hypothetical protein